MPVSRISFLLSERVSERPPLHQYIHTATQEIKNIQFVHNNECGPIVFMAIIYAKSFAPSRGRVRFLLSITVHEIFDIVY